MLTPDDVLNQKRRYTCLWLGVLAVYAVAHGWRTWVSGLVLAAVVLAGIFLGARRRDAGRVWEHGAASAREGGRRCRIRAAALSETIPPSASGEATGRWHGLLRGASEGRAHGVSGSLELHDDRLRWTPTPHSRRWGYGSFEVDRDDVRARGTRPLYRWMPRWGPALVWVSTSGSPVAFWSNSSHVLRAAWEKALRREGGSGDLATNPRHLDDPPQ